MPAPIWNMKPDAAAKLVEVGKQIYVTKYGCNGCHKIGEEGGKVGPCVRSRRLSIESDVGVSVAAESAGHEAGYPYAEPGPQ